MITFIIYLAIGAVVGIYAGLLGVGGGVIIVPVLDITLNLAQVDFRVAHHLALGTSMASIMLTSLSSGRSHAKRCSVEWGIVKCMAPAVFIGTLGGSFVVAMAPTTALKVIFSFFLFYAAMQIFFNIRPKSSWGKPSTAALLAVGFFIGLISSFIGIGGGTLLIPFIMLCGKPMLRAIGTSAVLGFPLALGGSIGFIINGWGNVYLPEYSVGFVYLPALVGLALAAMLVAPLGVRLAHYLPIAVIRKSFAVILLLLSLRMLWSVFK